MDTTAQQQQLQMLFERVKYRIDFSINQCLQHAKVCPPQLPCQAGNNTRAEPTQEQAKTFC